MAKINYDDGAKALSQTVDIAIEAIQKFPPASWTQGHIDNFLKYYKDFQQEILHPDPKFRTAAQLSTFKTMVLTYFQESDGKAVDYFWKEVSNASLEFKRVNRMTKILKRKKIKNQDEYDFVVDSLVAYHQDELIDSDDVASLNRMIGDFEGKAFK